MVYAREQLGHVPVLTMQKYNQILKDNPPGGPNSSQRIISDSKTRTTLNDSGLQTAAKGFT